MGLFNKKVPEFDSGTYVIKSFFASEDVDLPEVKLRDSGVSLPFVSNDIDVTEFQHLFRSCFLDVKKSNPQPETEQHVYVINLFDDEVGSSKASLSAAESHVTYYLKNANALVGCFASLDEAKKVVERVPCSFSYHYPPAMVQSDQCYLSIDEIVGSETLSRTWYKLSNGAFREVAEGVPHLENEGLFHQVPTREPQGYLLETLPFGSSNESQRRWFDMDDDEIDCPYPDDDMFYAYVIG